MSNTDADVQLLKNKIQELENSIKKIQASGIDRASPVFGISLAVCFIIFLIIFANAPIDEGERFVVGFVSLFAGVIVYGAVASVISFSLKAVVEIQAALLVLMNICVGAWAWPNWSYLNSIVIALGADSSGDELGFLTFLFVALCVAVVDAFVLMYLIPMSRIAGTSIAE